MAQMVLFNGRIFDGLSETMRDGGFVVIDDGRITEVGQGNAPAGGTVIDLAGRVLMPGLIDAHVHLIATTADLGSIGEDPASLTTKQASKIAEGMLMRVFTTVRDAGGADWGLALAIEEGLIQGSRLFYSGRVLSQLGAQWL